ncbi:hypothetical protein RRG08_040212 [Elysia crispata]|uniref:Uncharacterized protein n=1 Tax=Elysia crispata TaxID=231223 RepID=A0AAE0XYL4_9GAST|nr:hypothetical protein RRG08_040212 [Elysia crispata]
MDIPNAYQVALIGLELNLKRYNSGLPTAQTRCGVLTCEERIVDINNSGHAKGLFSSIVSLKTFKRNTNNSRGERGILFGSVSTETPNLTLVTNDAKIFGVLDDKQANHCFQERSGQKKE